MRTKKKVENHLVLRKSYTYWMLTLLVVIALSGFGLSINAEVHTPHHDKKQSSYHGRHKKTHKLTRKPVITTPTTTILEPSTKHPLSILSIGDSLGEDLGYGLQDIIGTNPYIHLTLDSVGSTGLANTAYYNWPVTFNTELERVHPQIVVVLIGGNDSVGFEQSGQVAYFGTPLWYKDYSFRVAEMMNEAARAKCHVFWVGVPIMASYSVLSNVAMQKLNSIYIGEAKAYKNVTYVSSWKLFQNSLGGFTQYLKDPEGMLTTVRDSDGVHIAPQAGQELIGSYVLSVINKVEKFHICPSNTDYWPEFNVKGCPN